MSATNPACPSCGQRFTQRATRPKLYCTVECQSKAANMRTNARRKTAKDIRREPLGRLKTPGAIPRHPKP
jgi:hypothetical protein